MKSVARILRKIMGPIAKIELVFGSIMLVTIYLFIMFQILPRYTPLPAMPWVAEIATYSLAWVTFSVIGYLIKKDGHITLETVEYFLPDKGKYLIRIFASLVVTVTSILFALSLIASIPALNTQTTPAIGIPLQVIYMVPLITFILASIHGLVRTFSLIFDPEGIADENELPGVEIEAIIEETK